MGMHPHLAEGEVPGPVSADESFALLGPDTPTKKAINRWLLLFWTVFPVRLIICGLTVAFFSFKYYSFKCQEYNGAFVSKDMFKPMTSVYTVYDFIFDQALHTVKKRATPF